MLFKKNEKITFKQDFHSIEGSNEVENSLLTINYLGNF